MTPSEKRYDALRTQIRKAKKLGRTELVKQLHAAYEKETKLLEKNNGRPLRS